MSMSDDIYASSMLNALTAAYLERAEAEEERDALRAKLDKAETQRDALFHECEALRKQTPPCIDCDRLRAKLDAIHRWVSDRADTVDRPDCGGYPNAELQLLNEFFEGRDPAAGD